MAARRSGWSMDAAPGEGWSEVAATYSAPAARAGQGMWVVVGAVGAVGAVRVAPLARAGASPCNPDRGTPPDPRFFRGDEEMRKR